MNELDENGHVIASESIEETEWDPVQRGYMLGLAYYEQMLCGKCGSFLGDSANADNDSDNPESPRHYVAEPPTVCNCCLVLSRSEREWHKQAPNDANAMIHSAVLVDRPRKNNRDGRVRRA